MNITVAKFGGTSMGTAETIRAVAEILRKISGGAVAVVSATSGTTDALIKLGELAVNGDNWTVEFENLAGKHRKICEELEVAAGIDNLWRNVRDLLEELTEKKEMPLNIYDLLIGFGERISSKILAGYLNKNGVKAKVVDAYKIIFTDNNFTEGNVDFEKTDVVVREIILPLLEKGVLPVITGFVGQSEDGQYITLGRGGSDYTGGIVAAALAAKELQIWTDVNGIFNADPRLINGAAALPEVSFNEASELAYFGAKVLHPKTIQPAVKKNIPVKVLNTFSPDSPGTVIDNIETESIKSVSSKKGISIINICSSGMLNAHGFLAKIFDVFAKHKVIVDVISTSEVSVSVTVDKVIKPELIEELETFSRVNVYEKMAIICLVGGGIKADSEVLGKMFSAISGYSVSMVSQGASQRNITFLVEESNASEIVKILFNTFFKQ